MFISDHGFGSAHEPDPYPLVRGTDPQIRIRNKMSRIRNPVQPMQLRNMLGRINNLRIRISLSIHLRRDQDSVILQKRFINELYSFYFYIFPTFSQDQTGFFLSLRIQVFDEMGDFLRKFETTCLARYLMVIPSCSCPVTSCVP